MDTRKNIAALWLTSLVVGPLAGGCATSSTAHHQDGPSDSETAEQLPDESAYRDAALKFLKYLDAQREAGTNVIQASGKNDGIYPMYECMEYGCPDRVFCKDLGAYCHVTHCGKGSCYGCPESLPETFKNLIFEQWCKFDCLKGSIRAGTALGFIPSIGNIFIGPYCLAEQGLTHLSRTHQKRPQMYSDPVSEKAARIAAALNGLGHIAFGHPLEWARSSMGDAKAREQFHEDATIVLDLVEIDAGSQSPATRRPAECKAALSRFRDMVQSVDFDDAASMATLKEYARQALEAFIGETLPETLPE